MFAFLSHCIAFLMLTVITQIGGLVYILTLIINQFIAKNRRLFIPVFLGLYLLTTFGLVPLIAPRFGRVPISSHEYVQPTTWATVLLNRNYVRPDLNQLLLDIGNKLQKSNKPYKLQYLDANFPFAKGFPLLPHRSHNDGRKIDLSFVYAEGSTVTTKTPSLSGYGVFEAPKKGEYNQIDNCLDKGYWQYSYAQYLTFGTWHSNLEFRPNETKRLIQYFLSSPKTQKIFIEPHLKSRLGLNDGRIRFHGCAAVRHDDHIHVQVK